MEAPRDSAKAGKKQELWGMPVLLARHPIADYWDAKRWDRKRVFELGCKE
jgi:hypothetical protein